MEDLEEKLQFKTDQLPNDLLLSNIERDILYFKLDADLARELNNDLHDVLWYKIGL